MMIQDREVAKTCLGNSSLEPDFGLALIMQMRPEEVQRNGSIDLIVRDFNERLTCLQSLRITFSFFILFAKVNCDCVKGVLESLGRLNRLEKKEKEHNKKHGREKKARRRCSLKAEK
jgi:hypothetical protein